MEEEQTLDRQGAVLAGTSLEDQEQGAAETSLADQGQVAPETLILEEQNLDLKLEGACCKVELGQAKRKHAVLCYKNHDW